MSLQKGGLFYLFQFARRILNGEQITKDYLRNLGEKIIPNAINASVRYSVRIPTTKEQLTLVMYVEKESARNYYTYTFGIGTHEDDVIKYLIDFDDSFYIDNKVVMSVHRESSIVDYSPERLNSFLREHMQNKEQFIKLALNISSAAAAVVKNYLLANPLQLLEFPDLITGFTYYTQPFLGTSYVLWYESSSEKTYILSKQIWTDTFALRTINIVPSEQTVFVTKNEVGTIVTYQYFWRDNELLPDTSSADFDVDSESPPNLLELLEEFKRYLA